MRHSRRTRTETADVAMTPMLDIVFILLIFFIVTSTFAQEDSIGLEAPLKGSNGQAQKAILIEVTEEGLVSINGRYTDIGAVQANIERVKVENPETMIVIQAMPRTKAGLITLIRDAAYNAGFEEGVSLTLARPA